MNQILFDWEGSTPSSKSILNRLMILRSFEPRLTILGESDCEDVGKMSAALAAFGSAARVAERNDRPGEAVLDCGAAGAVLRFLAARVSRAPGRWTLTGQGRLFERPHAGLLEALAALGASARIEGSAMIVETKGWRAPTGPVWVDRSSSSQFASGLALAAVDLGFDLELRWRGDVVSDGYWEMTAKAAAQAGLRIEAVAGGARVPAGQKLRHAEIEAEPDVSSAFAMAALGAVGGRARLRRFPFDGWQPDLAFPGLLAKMGARVERDGEDLIVQASVCELRALPEASLKNCPDLFPVLAVVCAYAEGTSRLSGAPHLAMKESARIESSRRLLSALGATSREIDGGLEIDGLGLKRSAFAAADKFDLSLNPEGDHRLAMAAAVANIARARRGEPSACVADPGAVAKSFPGFWREFERGLRR